MTMLFYLWRRIGEHWMLSRTAAWMLGFSAILSLAATPVFFGQIPITSYSVASRVFWGVAGILTPISIFFVWIGMWRYWLYNDESKLLARRLSFLLLLVGMWYGAVIYYVAIFLPQVRRRWLR